MKNRELKLDELNEVIGGIVRPQEPKPFKERTTADLISCLENFKKSYQLYMGSYEKEGTPVLKETADKFKANYDEVSAILIERIKVSL